MKYRRNKEIISGSLNDELIMMDIGRGKYFALNPIAKRIWELLENARSAEELCALLIEEYEVEAEQCLKEVKQHLEEMLRIKLIQPIQPIQPI